MIPYSSSNDYRFRNGCDAWRLTQLPPEQRDMGEWKNFEMAYLPPHGKSHEIEGLVFDIPKDALVLDVGGDEGDTAVFLFEHGYTNLRVVEPFAMRHENLVHNVEILRSLGCKVDLRLELFKPEHLEGVAFIKVDAEGVEWEPWFDLNNGGIPWGGELHMKGAPLREDGSNDYYCSIGTFRGDGQRHFRQIQADNMEYPARPDAVLKDKNWTYYVEPS